MPLPDAPLIRPFYVSEFSTNLDFEPKYHKILTFKVNTKFTLKYTRLVSNKTEKNSAQDREF